MIATKYNNELKIQWKYIVKKSKNQKFDEKTKHYFYNPFECNRISIYVQLNRFDCEFFFLFLALLNKTIYRMAHYNICRIHEIKRKERPTTTTATKPI